MKKNILDHIRDLDKSGDHRQADIIYNFIKTSASWAGLEGYLLNPNKLKQLIQNENIVGGDAQTASGTYQDNGVYDPNEPGVAVLTPLEIQRMQADPKAWENIMNDPIFAERKKSEEARIWGVYINNMTLNMRSNGYSEQQIYQNIYMKNRNRNLLLQNQQSLLQSQPPQNVQNNNTPTPTNYNQSQ